MAWKFKFEPASQSPIAECLHKTIKKKKSDMNVPYKKLKPTLSRSCGNYMLIKLFLEKQSMLISHTGAVCEFPLCNF
jgi:hypothetical protein